MRKIPFVVGEYYHIYNRGVDKRNIYSDSMDVDRFMESIAEFNTVPPIGSLYERSFVNESENKSKIKKQDQKKLVEFLAYCLNPNHFHFILKEIYEGGISEFMKRLGGYTWYYNNRHERNGALFQGVFKSSHIDRNEYLLHLSAYVNLNMKCHQLGGETAKLVRSSWNEYIEQKNNKGICTGKGIILDQFSKKGEYRSFALSSLEDIIERKKSEKELEELLID